MANLIAAHQINLPADFLWPISGFTIPSFPTSTKITITDGIHTQIFNGTGFTFDFTTQKVTGGTITSTEYLESGVSIYTADGFALPAVNLSGKNLLDSITNLYHADNTVTGSAENDKVRLFLGNDTVTGADGNDILTGSLGNDTLYGDGGKDVLSGGAGLDILVGGAGKDRLIGGADADTFVFSSLSDSGVKLIDRDTVADFISGVDKLDLSALDGDTTTAAVFNEVAAFTTAPVGEGEWMFNAASHVLSINTDTDVQAEFSVLLTGVSTLVASDLILG